MTTIIYSYLSQQDIFIPLPSQDRQLQGWEFTTASPSNFLPWHEQLSSEVFASLSESLEILMTAVIGGCLKGAEVPESNGFVSHRQHKNIRPAPLC